ncbi:MAG: RNA 2',3'-cyclic phosphodiesterase [Limisphaerales bacterium]
MDARGTIEAGLGDYRLFVALSVPEEVEREVHKAQEELRRAITQARVTWTRREQFHLTLGFLGNVAAGRVGALVEAVRGACGGFAPLRLRAVGVGCFPDMRSPRVVWLGVGDAQQALPRLQRAIQAASASFTSQESEERFSGHLTLGRIKGIGRVEAERLAGHARAMAERLFGEWTAEGVQIMRSELSPQGARHTVLATIPLKDDSLQQLDVPTMKGVSLE